MRDWIEDIKNILFSDRYPLPEGDLEYLLCEIDSRRRHRTAKKIVCGLTLAAGVAILFFVFPWHRQGQELGEQFVIEPKIAEQVSVQTAHDSTQVVGDTIESINKETRVIKQNSEATKIHTDEKRTDAIFEGKDSVGFSSSLKDSFVSSVITEEKKHESSRRLLIALSSHGLSTGGGMKVYTIHADGAINEENKPSAKEEYDHHQPATLGFSLSYLINDNWILTTGIDYSLCTSDVTTKTNGIKKFSLQQKARYIGVPFHLDWNLLQTNNFSLYIGAGGEAWRCLYAKRGETNLKDSRVYLSALGLAGLNYKPVRNVGIFIEPQYSHTFLPENPAVRTALTDNPDLFSLRLGLRFSFE